MHVRGRAESGGSMRLRRTRDTGKELGYTLLLRWSNGERWARWGEVVRLG